MPNLLAGRLIAVRITMLLAALAIVAVGIVTIYALGHPAEISPATQTAALTGLWKKQAAFTAAGIVAFLASNMINYRRLGAISSWVYATVIILLGILLVSKYIISIPFAPAINGAYRWIRIRLAGQDISLQPSELCKLAYVMALAWYLRYRSNYRNPSALVGPFILTIVPMIMILLEPNLGTVLLIMPIFFTMLFVAGAKTKHLLSTIIIALLLSPLLWCKMNQYQRLRISSVLLQNTTIRRAAEQSPTLSKILIGKEFDTKQWQQDWGYHLMRSKYAVASGGLKGYGFGGCPFIKYNFLPARHNDFIFAAIAQQWGFLGCVGILSLYAIIIGCGLEIATNNTDPFGRLLATGIVAMFSVEVIVNVGMTMGLMPITGLTLPLASYGGSSLVVSTAAVGLLNNIGRCRPFSVARKT